MRVPRKVPQREPRGVLHRDDGESWKYGTGILDLGVRGVMDEGAVGGLRSASGGGLSDRRRCGDLTGRGGVPGCPSSNICMMALVSFSTAFHGFSADFLNNLVLVECPSCR